MKPFIILFLSLMTLQSCSKDDAPKVNETIDLGEVSESLFEKNGSFAIDHVNNNPSQFFKFTITAYSKFDIAIKDFSGVFLLYNKTEEISITNDGGSLGGGFPNLEFTDSFEYSTELYEGEYEFRIGWGMTTRDDKDGTYELSIENINDLLPYEDLGILAIPFNNSFVPNPERARPTIYDFEISENTDWNIFVNGIWDSYSAREQAILYDEEGEIVFSYRAPTIRDGLSLPLPKGKYRLSFDSTTTLILGDSKTGDQDLGEISFFPFSQELVIDFTYEPDSKQLFYFQTAESSKLNLSVVDGNGYIISLKKSDGTRSIDIFGDEILPTGDYFLEFAVGSTSHNHDDYIEYSPLIGRYILELTTTD
ncbi:MAG: hypothetical protein ACR2MT_18155 [Aurantibacter sp.]